MKYEISSKKVYKFIAVRGRGHCTSLGHSCAPRCSVSISTSSLPFPSHSSPHPLSFPRRSTSSEPLITDPVPVTPAGVGFPCVFPRTPDTARNRTARGPAGGRRIASDVVRTMGDPLNAHFFGRVRPRGWMVSTQTRTHGT